VLTHTLRTFLACEQISPVVVVIHADDHDLYHAALKRADIDAARLKLVTGGPTLQ
jgi:2-C-methyl-D-erythritol 4-phosphate cytidylyltransferase/2-C-methyl-D-erythritol 2,4-cyclodiphosphate synthase